MEASSASPNCGPAAEAAEDASYAVDDVNGAAWCSCSAQGWGWGWLGLGLCWGWGIAGGACKACEDMREGRDAPDALRARGRTRP